MEESLAWKNLDDDVTELESGREYLSVSHTHTHTHPVPLDRVSPVIGQRLEFFPLFSAPGSLCDWEGSPGSHIKHN